MYRSRTTVSIGFDASPGALDPVWTNTGFTWTDVSTWVHEYSCGRGGGEMAGLTPGPATVVFDNTDGRFDPSNGSSPYAGQMLAGKPIRIREQINLLPLALSTGDDVASLTLIGAPTVTVSAAQARSASNSISVTAGAGTIGFTTPVGTAGYPVFGPGDREPLTASVWVKRTSATGRTVTVSVRFYDAAGSVVSTVSGTGVVSSASWQQVSVQTSTPLTAVFAAVRVEIAGAVVGDAHFVDDLHLVPSTSLGSLTWFPGGPIDVFRGSIDSWLPVQSFPGYASTTVAASGSWSVLGEQPFGESLWETLIARSRPDLWWRLGEMSEDEAAVDSSGHGVDGRYRRDQGGTPVTFVDGLIAQDSNGAVNFDSTWKQYIEGPSITTFTSGYFTFVMWIRSYPAASACTLFDSSRLRVTMSAAGAISAEFLGLVASSTRDVRDGQPHQIMVFCDSGGFVSVQIDNDVAVEVPGILGAERTQLRCYVGRDLAGTAAQYASITIDEVLLWQSNAPVAEWLFLAGTAGRLPAPPSSALIQQLTPRRLANFVVDLFGSPNAEGLSVYAGDEAGIQLDRITMSSPLEMLANCATMGQLIIFEGTDGTPQVTGARYRPSTSNAFLSDTVTIGQGVGEYPYIGDPVIDFGESSVINLVNVNRPDLATVTYRNQTSIDARGIRPIDVTLYSTVDRHARDLAAWLLNQYAAEGRRLTGIRPDVVRVDAAQMALLLEIGDVITVKDQTVDGRTITSTVRVVGKTVAKRRPAKGLPVLAVELQLSPIRIQPLVLDTGAYGQPGPAASIGKLGP